MAKLELDGKLYDLSKKDGLPIIEATCTTTQDGYDEEGNPILFVSVLVPAALIGAIPGRNGA